jgi:hypothetical protein
MVLGMMVVTTNPSTWEAKAGGWRVQGQPGLHNKILSQKKLKEALPTQQSLQHQGRCLATT